ncbi:MAG: ATP-binding response regulator [Candidatus Scalindua sp.]
MKVLIVDDNPKALAIAKARLKKEMLEILCVESGKRCVEIARKEKPDLILLDVDMPDISGFEVCQILKDDTTLCMIPVIFLTASNDNEDRVKGLDLGAVDYVTKPFDSFELRARVRAALRTKKLQDQLAAFNQKLEERVEQRTTEIEKLLRQKDAFVNQLSHDLKTPLTPLVALLPMLADRTEDPESKRMLELVMDNVDYMKNLTERTLQLARLNSPSVQLRHEKVDLVSEISNIIASLSSVFEENGIKVVNNITPPLDVEADRMLIKELIHNLISNAVKYTNRNGVITFDSFFNGDNVEILISDNGVGIEAEQLSHVFEEFYKVDTSRHDRSSTGLGLAICKCIIKRHGGSIWAESLGSGQGTTMHFTLPTIQGE